MKKNLDITKPRSSKRILPVPWPFVMSRFHCKIKSKISIVFYKKEETAFVFLSSHFKETVRKSKNEVKTFQSAIHYHPGHPKLNILKFQCTNIAVVNRT